MIASSPDKIENNGELFRPSPLSSGNLKTLHVK
jgi:hypothetical protein